MLGKIDLHNILFLDIETVPLYEDFGQVPEEGKYFFAEKTAYQRKDEITAEAFYERAGIWAEFGKIVCLSVGYFTPANKRKEFRLKSFIGEEKKLLVVFKDLIEIHFSRPQNLLCGHNAKEFDFPYVARRMLIHRISLPQKLQLFNKKPWEIPHLDTLHLWRFGDYKHYTSLKLMAHVLGIPSPKDDIEGSQVAQVYYHEKNIKRIKAYCEKDEVTVAQLFLSLTNEPLLKDNQIIFSDTN